MSVFLEILRCILCCYEEGHNGSDCDILERDPLLESSSYNSAVRSSTHRSNRNLPCHSDWNINYHYECYPNFSTSSSTTKKPSAVSQQSEYVNKSLNETKVSQSLKSSTPSPPSFSYNPIIPTSSSQSLPKLTPSSSPSLSSSKPYLPISISKTSSSKQSLSPPKAPQSLTQSPSFPEPASASSKPFLSSARPTPSSSSPSLSSSRQVIPPHKASSSISSSASSYLSQSLASPQALRSSARAKPPAYLIKPSSSLSGSSQSPTTPTPSSLKATLSSKPTLSRLPPDSTNQQQKENYVWVQKGTSPIYKIPKDIEDMIKKDIVPDVLKKPLSPSTYKDYFAALLYAEDFYFEKWSDFQLLNVTLELHEASIYDKSIKRKSLKKSDQKDDKFFVAFKIDSVPERRPFLLSRDFVYARSSGSKSKKFQGFLYRVVKSTTVLVEFEKDFYSQHRPNCKYDVSFSFNRVCLKRAHQAIAAASDSLFKNFLFPDCVSRKSFPSTTPCHYSNYNLDLNSNSAVHHILSFEGQPPYLVVGPHCVIRKEKMLNNEIITEFVLSKTGIVVREAVFQIYQRSPMSRILICAPQNRTCDVLMESLMEDMNILESDMFRANAAFREVDEVPDDILPLCPFEGECFSCPSLQDLRQYRVIFSTFVSSFRLHNEGIIAGHFSHIFLVDTSSAIEPETTITLSHFANENSTVIVTGAPYNHPGWVRSDIARENGLKMSYFERLHQTKSYWSYNPAFITALSTLREESDETFSFLSFV